MAALAKLLAKAGLEDMDRNNIGDTEEAGVNSKGTGTEHWIPGASWYNHTRDTPFSKLTERPIKQS
eukprot:4500905-Ditylum_brightwellii.AAC.1